MASDGNSGQTPITSLVHGSQAPVTVSVQKPSGKFLPAGGKEAVAAPPGARAPAAPATPAAHSDAQALVTALNKTLNDSGRPDEYRVAPQTDDKLIQQINPATGEVIGQFSAIEFPALARSVGAAGALIDSHA